MESNNNLSINNKESIKQKNYVFNWKKLRSEYILKQIFEHLNQKKFLKVIKHNKNIQNKLDINQKDYKKFCEIEIEIIPSEDKYYKNEPFINLNNKLEESFYHIYYNDKKEETKRKNRNYLTKNIKKIKIIIDYQVKSFEKLFENCKCIKSINFIKFNRNNINNMSYMFYSCSTLQEINLSNFNTDNVKNMRFMLY